MGNLSTSGYLEPPKRANFPDSYLALGGSLGTVFALGLPNPGKVVWASLKSAGTSGIMCRFLLEPAFSGKGATLAGDTGDEPYTRD